MLTELIFSGTQCIIYAVLCYQRYPELTTQLSSQMVTFLYFNPMLRSQGWLWGIVSGVGPFGRAGDPGRRGVRLPHHRGRLRGLFRHPPQISRCRENHHTYEGKDAFTLSEPEHFLNLSSFSVWIVLFISSQCIWKRHRFRIHVCVRSW